MSQSPDLVAHTGARMADLAADAAQDAAASKFREVARGYLPRVLWPLIPGQGGSVVENAKAAISRWFWGLVASAVISVIFFGIFAVAFAGFAGVTLFAVISN